MKTFRKSKTLDNQDKVISSLESRFNKKNNRSLIQAEKNANINLFAKEKETAQLRAESEFLTQQLAHAESLCKAKHAENIHLQQEIKTINAETEKIKETIALHQKTPDKQTSHKKKQAPAKIEISKETIGTAPIVTPTENPTSEDHKKKLQIKKMLLKEHNVKSERQLKDKLAKMCREQNLDGQVRLYGQGSLFGCSWKYSLSEDTLTINTESFSAHKNIKACLENAPSED